MHRPTSPTTLGLNLKALKGLISIEVLSRPFINAAHMGRKNIPCPCLRVKPGLCGDLGRAG